jgi:hypothetical protein
MRQISVRISSVLLVILLGLGVGCSRKVNDSKIASDVQAKFGQDSGLSTKQLGVQSNNGVVTLSGTVDDDAQRDAASRQAASVPGVKEVVNNLEVASATAPAAPPAAEQAAAAPPPEPEKHEPARRERRARSHSAREDANANDMASNQAPPPSNPAPAPMANPAPSAPPPPKPKQFIIDQGTQLTVRLIDPIDSEKNQNGDTFRASLSAPLTSDGQEAVPAGAEVDGHVVEVKSAGKFKGQSEVVLQLDTINSGGRTYNIQTDQYKKEGSSRGKNTAEKVGGGALIGTLIGALAGGGKGAAIGAAAGAGVGGGVQAATKGQQIKLPAETALNFTLQAPVTVVQASGGNRQRLNPPQ